MGIWGCLRAWAWWQGLTHKGIFPPLSICRRVWQRIFAYCLGLGGRWSTRKSWARCLRKETKVWRRWAGGSCSTCSIRHRSREDENAALLHQVYDTSHRYGELSLLTLACTKAMSSSMMLLSSANSSVSCAISFDSWGVRCLWFTLSINALRIWSGWMPVGAPVPWQFPLIRLSQCSWEWW
jgi:hypothetical protein